MSSKIRCLVRYIISPFVFGILLIRFQSWHGELCSLKGFRGIWLAGTTAEATQEGGPCVAKKRENESPWVKWSLSDVSSEMCFDCNLCTIGRQQSRAVHEEKISLEFTQFLCSLLLLPESSLDLKARAFFLFPGFVNVENRHSMLNCFAKTPDRMIDTGNRHWKK